MRRKSKVSFSKTHNGHKSQPSGFHPISEEIGAELNKKFFAIWLARFDSLTRFNFNRKYFHN
jgi:hypothetical protein